MIEGSQLCQRECADDRPQQECREVFRRYCCRTKTNLRWNHTEVQNEEYRQNHNFFIRATRCLGSRQRQYERQRSLPVYEIVFAVRFLNQWCLNSQEDVAAGSVPTPKVFFRYSYRYQAAARALNSAQIYAGVCG